MKSSAIWRVPDESGLEILTGIFPSNVQSDKCENDISTLILDKSETTTLLYFTLLYFTLLYFSYPGNLEIEIRCPSSSGILTD